MLRSLRHRLSYANVISTIALFLVVAGGTALAVDGPLPGVNQVGTQDIINNEVTRGDIGSTEVGTDEVANDDGTRALTGADIADGGLQAADLSAGAKGARAYGLVSSDGDLSREKNIAGVSHNDGSPIYCIDPAGGIAAGSAVLIVVPNGSDNETIDGAAIESSSVVEWRPANPACPAGTLEVVTYVHDGDETDNDGGVQSLPGDDVRGDPEGFALMIP